MNIRYFVLSAACLLFVTVLIARAVSAATPSDATVETRASSGVANVDPLTTTTAVPATFSMDNPLWAIPLGSLTITRDRPIFMPSRRPPAPAVVAAPPPAAPAPVQADPRPNLELIGTVVGKNESIGVFMDQMTHDFIRLKTGEVHAGWTLRSIKAREATLESEDRTETLTLPTAQEESLAPPSSSNQ